MITLETGYPGKLIIWELFSRFQYGLETAYIATVRCLMRSNTPQPAALLLQLHLIFFTLRSRAGYLQEILTAKRTRICRSCLLQKRGKYQKKDDDTSYTYQLSCIAKMDNINC